MAIFKLVPTDLSSPDWEASTYKGEVIVRAPDEEKARACATTAFVIAAEVRLGERVKFCPWNQPNIVSCERVKDSGYDESGDTKVLSPADVY